MTISNTARKAGPYSGNGVTTAFPFAFKVFLATDVLVVLRDANGAETTQTLTTQYTVSLNANQDDNPGGTVTMLTAPPTGFTISIGSQVPYSQSVILTNQGGFYPSIINAALDKLTALIQQLFEKANRTLALPFSAASNVSTTLPTPTATNVLGWNATGTALQNYTPETFVTAAANATLFANWQYQTFTGNGTTTGFALTGNPVVAANMDVSIAGVTQIPGPDFQLVGTTLQFVAAPPAGAPILVRYGQAATQSIRTLTAQTITATAGQTVFSLTTAYLPSGNNLEVYANGLRLIGGTDYLETGPSTVTMTAGAQAGDEITFVIGRSLGETVINAGDTPFSQGGTYAAGSMGKKLQGFVSVQDAPYGAKGDGIANDTTAIQAALAANLNVYFPPGNYLVQSPITLRTGQTIQGAGRTATTFTKSNYAGAVFLGVDVNQVTMSDFAIVGPGQWTGTGNKGIEVRIGSSEIVESLAFKSIDLSALNDVCLYVGSGAFVSYESLRARNFGYCAFLSEGGDGQYFAACTARNGIVGFAALEVGGFFPSTFTYLGCYAEQCGTAFWMKGLFTSTLQGCGAESAIYRNSTHNGTSYWINGGDSVSLFSCLSRNDTINSAISAPHVLVDSSAVRTRVSGFRRVNHASLTPLPTWEFDGLNASNGVGLENHNFTAGTIRGALQRFESSVQAVPVGYGAVSVAHGGPSKPDMLRVVLRRNSTAGVVGSVDASYATGDEVSLADCVVSSNHVTTTWANATQLGYGQVIAPPNITFKTPAGVSTANSNISTACWGIVFYAYWF